MISCYLRRAWAAVAGAVVQPSAFAGELPTIPRGLRQILATFGDPGTQEHPDLRWEKENIRTYRDLPGIPERWYFKLHRLAEPHLREGLRRAELASGYEIDRAGGFVLRHIRHDSKRPLSRHSYGIAVDFDASRNGARTFARGRCPVPWSDEWLELWPDGVDRAFVEAMESVGFTWGGVWGKSGGDFAKRAKRVTYCDPMHFELTRMG